MRGLNLPHVVQTRLDGKLDAEWPGLDYLAASGTGSATLTSGTTASTGREMPVAGKLTARANGGAIVTDLQRLSAAGTDMTGRIRVDKNRSLQGQVQVSVRDVGSTATAAEMFLGRPRGTFLSGTRQRRSVCGGTARWFSRQTCRTHEPDGTVALHGDGDRNWNRH
jgi:hypothetical protein